MKFASMLLVLAGILLFVGGLDNLEMSFDSVGIAHSFVVMGSGIATVIMGFIARVWA